MPAFDSGGVQASSEIFGCHCTTVIILLFYLRKYIIIVLKEFKGLTRLYLADALIWITHLKILYNRFHLKTIYKCFR